MALNIDVYVLLIFIIVQILCLRDETLIKYWIKYTRQLNLLISNVY
jgi:hypothetical protein